MATSAQTEANRCNSQNSTGPRTESGKAKSSRNRPTYGLYTHADYVKPDEVEIYQSSCQAMYEDLTPDNLLEETFVAEITGASWRLRRCAAAEAEISRPYRHETSPQDDAWGQNPYLDESTDRIRRSVERARAAAHSVIHRSLNQLRKLQTERIIRNKLDYGGINQNLAAESLKLVAAQRADDKSRQHAAQRQSDQIIASLEMMHLPVPSESELASNCNAGDLVAGSSSAPPQIARNASCPCRSGEKYKRCCGKTAPPVLGKAA